MRQKRATAKLAGARTPQLNHALDGHEEHSAVIPRPVVKLGLGVLFLMIGTLSCGLLMMRPPVDISDYCGEGAISHIKHPVVPGFRIDFDAFSLAQKHVAHYKLDCLPKPRWHGSYEVVLAIEFTNEEYALWPKLPNWVTSGKTGKLGVRLQDVTGRPLFDSQAELSTLQWRMFINDLPYCYTAWTETKFAPWIYPRNGEKELAQQPWFLEVNYEPGAAPPERWARVRVMAGGIE